MKMFFKRLWKRIKWGKSVGFLPALGREVFEHEPITKRDLERITRGS